jgi:hypothetical protein
MTAPVPTRSSKAGRFSLPVALGRLSGLVRHHEGQRDKRAAPRHPNTVAVPSSYATLPDPGRASGRYPYQNSPS